jgi:hypothetical protein
MSTMSIVINGLLRPDGTLELETTPKLPPGRVRVTLQPLGEGCADSERLPDPPWQDEAISAPFDLPRTGRAMRVQPRIIAERLPEPPVWEPEEERSPNP